MAELWNWLFVVGGVLAACWFQRDDIVRTFNRKKLRPAHERLLERTGARPVGTPLGKTPLYLASYPVLPTYPQLPYGARWTVQRTHETTVLGAPTEIRSAAFEWSWKAPTDEYEQRRRRRSLTRRELPMQLRSTTWNHLPVGAVELPVRSPRRLTINARSPLKPDRGGFTVESDQFNRKFHVATDDPEFALEFLTASIQELFLKHFEGRNVHVEDGLLLLTGKPNHEDSSLPAPISYLPAIEQDLSAIVRSMPLQFWRACQRFSR